MAGFTKSRQASVRFVKNPSQWRHTFTVKRFILLSFKHQTNKQTAIPVEQKQWQQKHIYSELQTTVTAVHISVLLQLLILRDKGIKLFDCNVTLRRVRITVVVMEYLYVINVKIACLYSCLNNPTRTALAQCNIVICGPSGCSIFLHIIPKTAHFRWRMDHKICVLISSTALSEILLGEIRQTPYWMCKFYMV
jgi:hypothetical protein